MRALRLQVQITVDGFVADPEGKLDWTLHPWDARLEAFVNDLHDACDTILLGRKMTEGFIRYWEQVKPDSREFDFARKMVGYPKIVFSRTVTRVEGRNVRVESGPLVEAVNRLKSQPGKDIIVYGGATFVSSLIEHGLIDELNLFVNPAAIGNGMRIFHDRRPLSLRASRAFDCGMVVNTYARGD